MRQGARIGGALAALTLAGCVTTPVAMAPRMAPPPNRPDQVIAVPETPASAAARAYYAQVQQSLLSQGLLRTDGGGPDTPFTDRMLADNFIRIALYDEYTRSPGAPIQQEAASRLRRWEVPVRVGLRFGASVSATQKATDKARIASYVARLARITGHSIRMDEASPNFLIYMVSEDERRAMGNTLAADLPGLSPAEVGAITGLPRSTYCLVYAMSPGTSYAYTRAVAVVRAEHPDLLRLSCIHEEVAQGLGLANDSPAARPSIFNDDEEFALLTVQDELMLKILYSPGLRTGMTEAEARPVVQSLAARLTGGS
ncbi:MAG: DUF2927 domain-containing protein [Paracoccaceae bacterium]